MCGYISALAPKEEKQFHGKGMMCMSFYNQAKKKFKAKSVASDNDKAWRTKRNVKGHRRKSWKRPSNDKETPTTHKKEFLNFCSSDYDVKNSEEIETIEIRDQLTKKRLGYDAYIKKCDVTLNFRYHGKLLMANAEDLVIAKRGKCNFAVEEVVKNDEENKIGYTVSVTLGAKVTRVKLKESDLKSCAVVRSAIKQMLGRLRQLKLDVVKVYCDEESSIKKIEEFEWSQELKAAFRELPPGVHAKRAEEKIRVIKDKMKCCNFALPFAVPYSIVGKLVAAAAQWTNQDCASANKGLTPPEVMVKEGKLIDFNHRGIAHFGELAIMR